MIYMLGTGAAVPSKNRGLPSIALRYLSDILLFDVGEGAQYKLIEMGLSPVKIRAIFITHLHGDHLFGLPGLIQTMAMYNRSESLIIYGPKGVGDYVNSAIEATRHRPKFNIIVREEDELYDGGRYIVKRFPVDHGMPSYGYVFEERKRLILDTRRLEHEGIPRRLWGLIKSGKDLVWNKRLIRSSDYVVEVSGYKIVYTGDTRPTFSVVENSLNADVLIHDSTFDDSYSTEAHSEGHSTAGDAGRIARLANAKMLVLTHISARYSDDARILVDDARKYHSNVVLAEDYMIIPL